jgi:signal transduction histidine kinase
MDANRQIVAANRALLAMLGAANNDMILGLRPGEAISCVNAQRGPGGCGTSLQCRHCGGVVAILTSQAAELPAEGDCTLACPNDGNAKVATFRTRVTPIGLPDERLYLAVFHDISASKRRELFDGLFVHDLSNLVSGLLGWTEELSNDPGPEAVLQVQELAVRIAEQLEEHKAMEHVERVGLKLERQPIDPVALGQRLKSWFGANACARGRHFVIEHRISDGPLVTDQKLLLRVLGNLIKNAFEATPESGTVQLTIQIDELTACFEIHNPGSIPSDVAAQLLNVPVTTKRNGHGLGLHSVKVFGELYLGGAVSFESNPDSGTFFRFELPLNPGSGIGRDAVDGWLES